MKCPHCGSKDGLEVVETDNSTYDFKCKHCLTWWKLE